MSDQHVYRQLSAVRAVPAEGARVGFMSCLECGAVLMLDPDEAVDVVSVHQRWHKRVMLAPGR